MVAAGLRARNYSRCVRINGRPSCLEFMFTEAVKRLETCDVKNVAFGLIHSFGLLAVLEITVLNLENFWR